VEIFTGIRAYFGPHTSFMGKIGAIKYCNLADNDIVSEMVVVVGMEAPSRVWCTMGICDGKSLGVFSSHPGEP